MRCFFAFPISLLTRQKMVSFAEKFSVHFRGNIRPVALENLHLTLHFFPHLSGEEVEKIRQNVPTVLKGFSPFAFSIADIGAFPDFARPRVLWLGVQEGKNLVIEIKRSLDGILKQIPIFFDEKVFHPHITVARLKNGKIRKEDLPVWEEQKENAEVLKFYQSMLTPAGPVYQILAEFPLGGGD